MTLELPHLASVKLNPDLIKPQCVICFGILERNAEDVVQVHRWDEFGHRCDGLAHKKCIEVDPWDCVRENFLRGARA